ncbi:MAG: tetratricopeptide repeat protein [Emcibacteraceae bacterium]|nr:tetratricopeptide repeat protein [Emcibacteraceae bacterium]
MSDTFIREVDEDLRQKQLSSLWKKYGKIVIGIAVGLVLVVAGRSLYIYSVESKYNEQATAYSQALKLNNSEISKALDPVMASDVDGYQIIAAFKKVELALAAEDKLGAIAILDQFIATSSVDQIYKDIANIQAVIIEIDTAPVDNIRARLSLILDGGSTFQYLAAELLGLSELKNGEIEAAKTRLQTLIENVDAPVTIKSRAEQYLSVVE